MLKLKFTYKILPSWIQWARPLVPDKRIEAMCTYSIEQESRGRFTIENRTFNEQKNRGYGTDHNFGHFGNLPNVFFGLAQIANLMVQLFSFWREAKRNIQLVGGTRRYFERLAVIISSSILPEDNAPILYFKFEFNST